MGQPKQEIVSFKVDASLLQAIKAVPNRSDFIRKAIMHMLNNVCPLCQGTGALTPNQKKHWDKITANHPLEECDDCHEVHLVCAHDRRDDVHDSSV